ncbi:HD-GYP domain-containing protein [Desulfosporosinus nitroreducens]|uniref:HD-GYP domain-containing protein n=1 Tax=Desulfosporosinus nitroreducens TaxID=2018668 RepID=UPI00207C845A|nr:HD-GYP domain-containing protein [Desulfosporosinus nitroreducens]MCO1602183.1 HD-GYP domain-containing protein [Desulfosporosinus nitroreducens]
MNVVLEKLPPGLFLQKLAPVDLFDTSGLLLLTRGQLITDRVRERLVRSEVYTLISEKDHVNSSGTELKTFPRDLYLDIVGSIWSIYHDTGLITSEQIAQTMVLIELIIMEINGKWMCIDNDSLRVDLASLKEHDYCTFVHAVNVAILSTIIARGLGYQGQRLRYLTMGAILHDIGKIKVPCEILNKPGLLSEKELIIIKRHPIEGEKMLHNTDVSPIILNSVRLHHERWSGNGYPDGLSGSRILLDAQIIAIADVYDALTADRPYRKALPPYHALEMILTMEKDFNPIVVTAFRNSLNLYPKDTLVTLNTGEIGVVVAVPTNFPTRPLVRLMFDCNGKYSDKEIYIDLMNELTYFIKSPSV